MRMNAKYKGPMQPADFIRSVSSWVLRFGISGSSGRQSPYASTRGSSTPGGAIAAIGRYYARCGRALRLAFDMSSARRKGIPLVDRDCGRVRAARITRPALRFNRKETKDHGEGGTLIGAPLAGRVLIVDDVITAGTAIRESVQLIAVRARRRWGLTDCTRPRGNAVRVSGRRFRKHRTSGPAGRSRLLRLRDR